MKNILLIFLFVLGFGLIPAQQKTAVKKTTKTTKTTKAKAVTPTKAPAGTVLKKDGTPDKRYKSSQKLKKDGTLDRRYKENK